MLLKAILLELKSVAGEVQSNEGSSASHVRDSCCMRGATSAWYVQMSRVASFALE